MKKKQVNSRFVNFTLEDGILIGEYMKGLEATLEIAKECVKARIEFTQGNSYPALADIRYITSATKEARDYFSKDENIGVTAGAMLVNSAFSTLLGNFYLKITFKKNAIPTKLFSNKASAINWLRQFKQEDSEIELEATDIQPEIKK
ncbi:MAG: STAS/SEC14 domain-containing protein [Bacteroidetes bacterium]|nr:MAG: STAS/SEC14 domain-containing protein [Bacteroidota bacterium]